MINHSDISSLLLHGKIKKRIITHAGNRRLKIFGLLNCKSGKRMKKENRVFFKTQAEALQKGFRPCAHCLKELYRDWKYNPKAE